jgi:hypothetical protein
MDMHRLTDIFCQIDDFCNTLNTYTQDYMLTGPMRGKRGPSCSLAMSEIMTILLMFQSSRMRDFFLGFTDYCDKTRRGHFKGGRKTSAKKFRAKAKDINIWLKAIRNLVSTKDWWELLGTKLRESSELLSNLVYA